MSQAVLGEDGGCALGARATHGKSGHVVQILGAAAAREASLGTDRFDVVPLERCAVAEQPGVAGEVVYRLYLVGEQPVLLLGERKSGLGEVTGEHPDSAGVVLEPLAGQVPGVRVP